jgi:hypothetical protein
MPALVMGGLALAQGIFGGIMGASQAEAQAIAQQLAAQNQNFQNKWRNEAENRNLLRQMEAQELQNIQIAKLATQERAANEFTAKQSYLNTRSNLSKQTQQTNDMFLTGVSGRNISSDSASVKALLRQNMSTAEGNMSMIRSNYGSMMQDIEAQYKNRLAQRNNGYVSQRAFLPQAEMSVDSSSSALMSGIAQGVFGAASAGFAAQMEWGGQGRGLEGLWNK